jgi:hypothetical protein
MGECFTHLSQELRGSLLGFEDSAFSNLQSEIALRRASPSSASSAQERKRQVRKSLSHPQIAQIPLIRMEPQMNTD